MQSPTSCVQAIEGLEWYLAAEGSYDRVIGFSQGGGKGSFCEASPVSAAGHR